MEQLLVILAVVVGAVAALYCVRLLDRAWRAIRKRRARRSADTHEEVHCPDIARAFDGTAGFYELAHLTHFLPRQGVPRDVKAGDMAVELHLLLAAAGMAQFCAQPGRKIVI